MNRPLSIVIPTWNGRELLQRFLPSVIAEAERWTAASGGSCEIVLSDDGSTDETLDWLRRAFPAIRTAASPVNRGFAPAANAGVEAARGELVVLLNNDLELTPGALDPLCAWFDQEDLFGVTLRGYDLPRREFATGGKLGRFRRGFWETWRNFEQPRGESFLLVGGFCVFRRAAFLEMGGFDPIFAPYYSEDLDLSYRARKRGWRLGYEPGSLVHHAQSSSVRRHRTAFRRAAVIERNRLLFHWRNLDPARLRRHLAWAHVLLLQMLLKGHWAYHAGYFQAVRRLGAVRDFRRRERAQWRRSDAELELATPPPTTASACKEML
ncbi:MAG TPA: glycosyltransferase family 2 protein [Terriglobales bacterium]|nr:glycosyltransferase family 2 protein [Terriglobales bacterium]